MGNASSCAPVIFSITGTTKVLFPDGSMHVYTKPVRAGELMLENPGQFICKSYSLKVGQRILGLSADEELEPRQLYFLLPMELVYSVLTDEEMSTLADKTAKALENNKLGNSKNFGKIFPVLLSDFCMFPSTEAAKTTKSDSPPPPESDDAVEPVERYAKQRSWKPVLETIAES